MHTDTHIKKKARSYRVDSLKKEMAITQSEKEAAEQRKQSWRYYIMTDRDSVKRMKQF